MFCFSCLIMLYTHLTRSARTTFEKGNSYKYFSHRLTILRVSPCKKAFKLAHTSALKRPSDSFVAHAACGVKMVLGALKIGRVISAGSTQSTSAAKPPSVPSESARHTACSSTNEPRAVFTKRAPRLHSRSKASLTSPLVSSVAGQCRLMASERQNNSCKGTNSTASSPSRGVRVLHKTCMPNAFAICATLRPIAP